MFYRVQMSFVLASLLALAGCSGSEVAVPELHPVRGKVSLGGKPAERVAVAFVPLGRTDGGGGNGMTDAGGNYSLMYRTGQSGLPKGEYAVVFSKVVQPDGSPIPEGKTAADVNARNVLPARFGDASAESPFRIQVPGKPGDFDFNLPMR